MVKRAFIIYFLAILGGKLASLPDRGDVKGRPGPQSSSSLHLSLRKCYQAMLAWLFECEIKESLVYASDFRLTMLSRGLPLLPDFWAMPEINFIFARSSLKLDNISFLRT